MNRRNCLDACLLYCALVLGTVSGCTIHLGTLGASNGGADGGSVDAARGDGAADVAPEPQSCPLDCRSYCAGRPQSEACGGLDCLGWQCDVVCANNPSAAFCCEAASSVFPGNSDTECYQRLATGVLPCSAHHSGDRCGTPSSLCGGNIGSATCPSCCTGICGETRASCVDSANCCVTACGSDNGTGITDGLLCNNQCVNWQADRNNCGGCGVVCPSNAHCQGGSCVCDDRETSACGSTCVRLDSVAHCGSCDNACGGGSVCRDGACVCVGGQVYSHGTCCASPMVGCNGTCVDLFSDSANCGACANACSGDGRCVGGVCACDGTLCSGHCTDIYADPSNCGACGHVCPAGAPGTQPACVEGVCTEFTLVASVTDTQEPVAMFVAGGVIYLVTSGKGVDSVPAAGGMITPFYSTTAGIYAAATDGNAIYFVTGAGVNQLALTPGSQPQNVAPEPARDLIAGPSGVYWIASGDESIDGGPPGRIRQLYSSSPAQFAGIAFDGSDFAWLETDGGLYGHEPTCSLRCNPLPPEQTTEPLSTPFNTFFGVDAQYFYVDGRSIRRSDGQVSELSRAVLRALPDGGGNVYLDNGTRIERVSADGNAHVVVARTTENAMALDATRFYWLVVASPLGPSGPQLYVPAGLYAVSR